MLRDRNAFRVKVVEQSQALLFKRGGVHLPHKLILANWIVNVTGQKKRSDQIASSSAFAPFDDNIESGGVRKCAEIPISGYEANFAIETSLGDQCVSQARAAPSGENLRSQRARSMPIAGLDLDERKLRQRLCDVSRKPRVAQQFHQHGGNHEQMAVRERSIQQLGIFSPISFEESDPGAGVGRDHRSALSSSRVRENRTFPRSCRSFE